MDWLYSSGWIELLKLGIVVKGDFLLFNRCCIANEIIPAIIGADTEVPPILYGFLFATINTPVFGSPTLEVFL